MEWTASEKGQGFLALQLETGFCLGLGISNQNNNRANTLPRKTG